jgi:NAD-reducing hydrogenase small subunit
MSKLKLATLWLDGCSGCHMSFLDMDERILTVLEQADLVYSPLVDIKHFPEHVDITLVEGAVSNQEDLVKVRKVRKHTTALVAFGDCAVTGNVPSMRNVVGRTSLMETVYVENATIRNAPPDKVVPKLLQFVCPVHEVVPVDVFVPGCPPSADTVFHVLQELLAGRVPQLQTAARFGA